MWTKILIFMIIFFLVANPATFKIMRKLLGTWVASADGLATPAGLILHGLVLVLLAMYLPRILMTYEEQEEFEDEGAEGYAGCPTCAGCPGGGADRKGRKGRKGRKARRTESAAPVVATTSGPSAQAVVAPGAAASAPAAPVTVAAPTPAPAPAPSGTTSPYFEWNY